MRDGLLDGILDCLVTGDVHVARRGCSGRREAGGFFVQGGGEAAEGTGAAGRGGPAFQPGDSGWADPGPVGELFLGQPALVA
jgi:hypothetical protein